jgi:signal peptidase I
MRRLADVGLWVGAVLGALSLVAAVLVATLGLVPLIFTSGSMSPAIPAGSLGVARSVPAAELAVDDVVSVDSADGARVTHRVVAIEETADGALLTLQGDANSAPDADPYPVTEADRLLFSVPGAGSALAALAHPVAIFGGGVLAAAVVLGVVSSSRGRRANEGTQHTPGTPSAAGTDRRSRAGRVAASVLVAALPAALAFQPAAPTAAAFSDTGATVNTSGFVSHRVHQPTSVTCSGTTSITVTTPASDPRYTYWAQAFTPGPSGTALAAAKPMTGTGASRQAAFTAGEFTPPLAAGNYEVRVYARVGSTSWQSADYVVQPFSATTGTTLACGNAPIPPTITFTEPDGVTKSASGQRAAVLADCGANQAACGTVTDNGSIASVTYILQRSGLLLGTGCWDHTSSTWRASSQTACAYRTATHSSAGAGWFIPGAVAAVYQTTFLSNTSYQLTIRAVDNEGLVTVRTITFATTPG